MRIEGASNVVQDDVLAHGQRGNQVLKVYRGIAPQLRMCSFIDYGASLLLREATLATKSDNVQFIVDGGKEK